MFDYTDDTTITLYYDEDIREDYGPINTQADMKQNYDDFLDETNNPIRILGVEYSFSDIFQQVDPIAYDQNFLDYIDGFDSIEVPMNIYMTDQERAFIVAYVDGTDFIENTD